MQASHGCSVAGRAWHSVARPALTAPPASSQPPRRQRGASSSQNARRSDAGSWDPASSLLSALRDATRSRQDTISEQAGQAVQEGLKILGKFVEPLPSGFPPGPAGDFGLELASDPLRFISSASSRFGGIVGFKLAGERVVLVSRPDVARTVLIDRSDIFVKTGTAFFPNSSLAGEGLLVSDGAVWQRQRRLANPAFRKAAIEGYADAMSAGAATLVQEKWGPSGGDRDIFKDFNDATLSIAASALFGEDVRGQEADRINAAISASFEFFAQRSAGLPVPEWLPTPDNVRFLESVSRLDEVIYGLIARRRQELLDAGAPVGKGEGDEEGEGGGCPFAAAAAAAAEAEAEAGAEAEGRGGAAGGADAGAGAGAGADATTAGEAAAAAPCPFSSASAPASAPAAAKGNPRGDLLTRLLLARDDEGDGDGMADKPLRDELMTLLVAGQETSAILLSWCCANLAAHPDAADRVAEEAERVLSADGSADRVAPGSADLVQLVYTEAVILETLRLNPPAYLMGRCAAEDTRLRGWLIPKGTTILVSPFLIQRDPANWADPLAFKPERWLSGEEALRAADALKGTGPRGSFLPFGAGPRVCIGTGFALLEASILLAAACKGFRMSFPPGTLPPEPKPAITLRPAPFTLRLTPRKERRAAAAAVVAAAGGQQG